MGQEVMEVTGLPDLPLAAADMFHSQVMPEVAQRMAAMPHGGSMVLVFDPADQAHGDWRLAAVRTMARACAPALRFNGVVGHDRQAIDEVLAFLASAPAITGQVFDVHGTNG